MTIPNVADFDAAVLSGQLAIICPQCGDDIDPKNDWLDYEPPKIRDLIAAASAHATIHARTEVHA